MAAPIALRGDFDGWSLRGVAKSTRDGKQIRRLLALAEIYDGGSRGDAARIGGVGLQTIRDWVLRFNAKGLGGLIDGKAPGRTPKLNPAQREALGDGLPQTLRQAAQKNKLARRWARRGSRPRAANDQRTSSAYLFGAICPKEGKGAGLVLPFCNSTLAGGGTRRPCRRAHGSGRLAQLGYSRGA